MNIRKTLFLTDVLGKHFQTCKNTGPGVLAAVKNSCLFFKLGKGHNFSITCCYINTSLKALLYILYLQYTYRFFGNVCIFIKP